MPRITFPISIYQNTIHHQYPICRLFHEAFPDFPQPKLILPIDVFPQYFVPFQRRVMLHTVSQLFSFIP